MTIELSPEQERILEAALKHGQFSTADEALTQALESITPQEAKAEEPKSPKCSLVELFAPLRGLDLDFSRHEPLNWSQCPAVESIPGKVSGAWLFKGTRMPVQTVFENLAAGLSIDEIVEVFDVTADQIKSVVRFAAQSLDKPPTFDAE